MNGDTGQVHTALVELARMVADARTLPLSSSVVLPREDLLSALHRLETAYDEEIAEARDLVSRRTDLVRASEDEASEIVRAANLEQGRLVSDTEVFKVARREGEELVANARAGAETLRRDTEAYVETRLAQLQHALERTLAEVRRGITNLTGNEGDLEAPAPAPADVLLAEPAAG